MWLSHRTVFRVFDVVSQTTDSSWRNSRQQLTKFYDNWGPTDIHPNLLHDSDLL